MGLHCRRAGKWDHQILLPWAEDHSVRRPAQEDRTAELAQMGGRPAKQAPPHRGRDPLWDTCTLWEWKPMQYIPHILGYVVKFLEPPQ